MNNYYIVSSKILPEVIERVLFAKKILNEGSAKDISEACQIAGISRGTFYKYKDTILEFDEHGAKRASVSLTLHDEKGTLYQMLQVISSFDISVQTISQTLPVNGVAGVTMTLDITDMDESIDALVGSIKRLPFVKDIELIAVE